MLSLYTMSELNIKLRSKEEKCKIVIDIVKKLKYFKGSNGQIVNLYNKEFSYYQELTDLFNNYIKCDEINKDNVDLNGIIRFNEIGLNVEYILPITYKNEPLFVMRSKIKGN
jgi:hypothetical protein